MPLVERVLADVLRREGGYVHHPADKGGPTKYGITQATLSEWLGRKASVQEVRDLDIETAREIYVSRYLTGPRIDTLPESVVPQVFDIAVNSGPRKAVRMLQEVLCQAGFECDQDGTVGPQTRRQAEAAAAAMGWLLVDALACHRAEFFRAIVASNPSQRVFLKGWLRRAAEFTNSPQAKACIMESD